MYDTTSVSPSSIKTICESSRSLAADKEKDRWDSIKQKRVCVGLNDRLRGHNLNFQGKIGKRGIKYCVPVIIPVIMDKADKSDHRYVFLRIPVDVSSNSGYSSTKVAVNVQSLMLGEKID